MGRRTWISSLAATTMALCVVATANAEVFTLEQAVQRALETNGSLQYNVPGAKEGFHRSKQSVWTSWGLLLPSATFNLGHDYFKSPAYVDSLFDPDSNQYVLFTRPGSSVTGWSSGFSFDQTLFDGAANWYRVAQSYNNRKQSFENMRGAENNLVLGVKEAYFAVLKATELVGVQEAAVRRAEQFHKTIESRYELGSASLSEVLKAKVQLGTEQLTLLQRQNDVKTNTANLNTILNRDVDSPLELADVPSSGPSYPTYERALTVAHDESPDILSAEANTRSAKNEVGIARGTLFPSISWSARRSYEPENSGDLLSFDGSRATWSVGISLGYRLFDAFHWKTANSNARVAHKYARETERQTEMAVELGVKQAFLGVELANQSRELAEQTEESAQEDFNLAQEKYNLGAATILDLLDAQASLTRAQTDRVNALYDQYVAVARLENATGRR